MKINQFATAAMACTFLALGAPANANEGAYQHPAVPEYSKWNWRVDVDASVAIDSKAAAQEGIKDSAVAFSAGAEYAFANTAHMINFGFSFLQYSDRNDFKVLVEDSFGDTSLADSDASAFILYADYGIRKRFGATNAAYYSVRGGYALAVSSERSVANCDDCPSQDIDIDGGLYGLVGLGYSFTEHFSLELNYKPYFSGDLDSAIQLGFFWTP